MKISSIQLQNSNCDNQEQPLIYPNPTTENLSLMPASRMHSMDLMSNIQLLISDRLVKLLSNLFFSLQF